MYFYNNRMSMKNENDENRPKLNLQSQHFLKIINFLIETDNLRLLNIRLKENELHLIESVLSERGKCEFEQKDLKHRFELRLINSNDIIGLDDFVKYVFCPEYNKNSIINEMEVIQTELNKSNLFSDLSFNKYVDIKSLYSCEVVSSEAELCVIERSIFNKIIYMNQYLFYESFNSFTTKMNFLLERIHSHSNKILINENTRSKEMVKANKNLLLSKDLKLGLEENEQIKIEYKPWNYDLHNKINETIKTLVSSEDQRIDLSSKLQMSNKFININGLKNKNLLKENVSKSKIVVKLENLYKNESKSVNFNSKIYLSPFIDLKHNANLDLKSTTTLTLDQLRKKNNSVNYDLEKQKHLDDKKRMLDKIKEIKYKRFKLKKKNNENESKINIENLEKNDEVLSSNNDTVDNENFKSLSNLQESLELDSKSEMKININSINLTSTLNSNNFNSITSRMSVTVNKNNGLLKKIEKYKKMQNLKDKLFNIDNALNDTENKNNNFLSTDSTFYSHAKNSKNVCKFKGSNDKYNLKSNSTKSIKSYIISGNKSEKSSIIEDKKTSNKTLSIAYSSKNYNNEKICSKTIDFNNLIVDKKAINSWETFNNSKFVDIFTRNFYRNQFITQNKIYSDLLNKNK